MISSSWKSKKLDRNITTSDTTAIFLNDEPKFMIFCIFCIFLNPSNFYYGRFQLLISTFVGQFSRKINFYFLLGI